MTIIFLTSQTNGEDRQWQKQITVLSIIVPCAFYQISLDAFTRTSPYLLVVGCVALSLVIAAVYCALDEIYTHGRFQDAERVLERYCEEYERNMYIFKQRK